MISFPFSSLGNTLEPLVHALQDPKGKPFLVGPHGSSLGLAITLLAEEYQSKRSPESSAVSKKRTPDYHPPSCLILTPTEEEAGQLYQDLVFFHQLANLPVDHLVVFPHSGTLAYESVPPPIDMIAHRMQSLHHLNQSFPTIAVASVRAILQKVLPQSVFSKACLLLKPGVCIEREPLATHLLQLGYRRVSVVEIPGEFSIRGGIIDIFSTAYDNPIRVEFLGDTVESTRLFDPETQESIGQTSETWVLPAKEYLSSEDQDLEPRLDPASNPLKRPISTETIVDYFSDHPLLILDRPHNLAQIAQEWWDELFQAWEQREEEGAHPSEPAPDYFYSMWNEFEEGVQGWSTLSVDTVTPSSDAGEPLLDLPIQSPGSMGLGIRGTTFSETIKILERLRDQGLVIVIARNEGQVGRLLSLFSEYQSSATRWNYQEIPKVAEGRMPFFIIQGEVSSGFVSSEGQLAVVTEEELFAKAARHRPQQKSKSAAFFSSLDDLNQGDYVVHVQHGISRYQGLRRLVVQGFESDYLILQFAGRDTLYVPLDRLNLVQRYRGSENHGPKLDKLGGTSWAKTTARVKKGIEDMAEELVELYASREVVERASYQEDSTMTHEFEASFEFEETPDQSRAIQEIQKDLESSKPMDRLVCGDVGYGKTEVAMRAAFKAVQDNRQVAVLVPTTLLAQQHYETFCRRFSPFPVRIGVLSRFQTPKEVKALLLDLASGVVDIVIGTHRVLQKTVQFKNLGLVIIDEEQWFGVRHKERMKQMRTQVDVLTLTATPIPRTLQMAFSGVRDLSVIETPPQGRMAIRTHVMRFDPNVVREAIRRELARGGQAFFVHNRVQTMERTASWLQELLPEARITMAHGQMDERILESVMLKFFHGEVDILVASAIIQSGLDIPRANTILVDRADTFGLAQLYQLRGRVGRAGDQAYAYFFFPNEEVLSTDAQKRLMAIQEFADLGSGFRIAAADLEIRGAGNLLGKQQSGNIAAIGLDLYMKMVEEAVQRMKGQEIEVEIDPTLHLNVSAYIPEDYVEDGHQRLSLYKRLSASHQIGDLALLHGETQDRYGPLPDPVERLFEVMQIKLLASQLRIETLEARGGTISLSFVENAPLPESGFQWLMDYAEGNIQFHSPRSCEIVIGHEEWTGIVQELNTILTGLKGHVPQLLPTS
jgi:transcription-repair coupling factor (superfamily II helicase)